MKQIKDNMMCASFIRRAFATSCAVLSLGIAQAAQTDISSTPFSATVAAQAKPNIMLLMDTSGSMGWGHMPDEVETVNGTTAVGYKSSACNVVYYNPSITYVPPKKSDGTPFPVPSYNAAPYDAYAVPIVSVNLATSFQAYDNNTIEYQDLVNPSFVEDVKQPAYYYMHTGGSAITAYTAPTCSDTDSHATQPASDGGTWTRLSPTSSAANQQNFTIWYSYYRTRILLVKTAASLAFTPLTDSFRVGFITMKPKDTPSSPAINPAAYLPINDFNSTQRSLWYSKLFSQQPKGSSPAREGLARVGRHYAGKQDGINAGMTGDPVQYYCQQNFTIMTTDGYWNAQEESTPAGGYLGGPVDKSGMALVGDQDANRTDDSGDTPRPIWQGVPDGTQTTTNNSVKFSTVPCGTYFNMSTVQQKKSTSQVTIQTTQTQQTTTQNLQSQSQTFKASTQAIQNTSQTTQATSQNLQSTNQNRQNVTQNTQSVTQITQSTVQNVQMTTQNLQSTTQNLQTTSGIAESDSTQLKTVTIAYQNTTQMLQSTNQNLQSTTQMLTGTTQRFQSTVQNLSSTNQNLQSTAQTQQRTVQNLQNTAQNLQSTSQTQQTSAQVTQSTSQSFSSTYQVNQATAQINVSTSQVSKATAQQQSCNGTTEKCSPSSSATCATPGYYCKIVYKDPKPVATCTNSGPTAANSYTTTTCTTATSGPTPAASCTQANATFSNSYTATSCNTVTNGPTPTPVAACNPSAANAGNNYTSTTCTPVVTGPTASSCTPVTANAGNAWTDTTCSYTTSGPTGVASCTPSTGSSSNSWVTTTCGTNNTSNMPVPSCTTQSPTSSNGYATVSCNTVTTSNVPVQTCSAASPTSSNNWTTTSCGTNNTSNVPVASCTASAATSANNWTTTTCPSPNTTAWVGVSSCTPVLANSANTYTATACQNVVTTNVPVASCTPATAMSSNSYTTTTCPAPVTTSNVPVASCTGATASSANSYTTTTCSNNNTSNVAVASCTASAATSGNAWTTTTCPAPVTTGPTGVAACTPIPATSANSYTATTCTPNNTTNVPVASCTAALPTSGNGYTTTTCPTPNSTSNVPVPSCTNAPTPNAGNAYTTTTCTPNNTSNVAVASCTASTGTAGNGYTVTTCPAPVVQPGYPMAVSSCSADAPTMANGYKNTSCSTSMTTTGVSACTPQAPTMANGYVTVTCSSVGTANVPVASCTPQGPTSANGYLTTTCPAPYTTTNVPIPAACVASAATSSNNWTKTTCPAPVTTGPTAVATCTAVPASAANSYVATTCPAPVTTGPTGVASCSPILASPGNSYVATTCGNGNSSNTPVSSCTPQIGDGTNAWKTISCGNNNTSNTPVATCTPQTGSSSNSWITITCAPSVVTTNVPVQTCTPVALATAANNYTTTTCSTNTPLATASGTCVPIAPTSANSWTTTTCPVVVTGPTYVASCTAATGNSTNSWTTTTCSNNNVASAPVSSCTPVMPSSPNYLTVSCATVTSLNVPVQTCSSSPATLANGYQSTSCSVNTTTVPSGTCVPSVATSANNWTTTTCPVVVSPIKGTDTCMASGPSSPNWTTTTCPTNATTGPTPSATCTASPATSGNSWVATTCTPITTGPTIVPTCNPASPTIANDYTSTVCAPISGSKLQYVLTNTVSTSIVSGGHLVGSPAVTTTVGSPTDYGVCIPPSSPPPVLPSPNPQPAGNVALSPLVGPSPPSSCSAWPCTTNTYSTGAKSINSLADVAQYYYVTDLRTAADWPPSPPNDVSTDGVPNVGSGPEDDRRHWQHMTTFSIALGVSGTLQYRSDYKTASSGDFYDIRCAVPPHLADESNCKNWPLWPDPSLDYAGNPDLYSDPRSIDDFWHAAVNGRGQFFSAANPTSVIAGLAGALAGINSKTASGSGPGLSTLNPVAGNHSVYVASYRTQYWDGDVQAYYVDVNTGDIDTTTAIWSASAKLDTMTSQLCDNRNIYLIRTDGTKPNNLANFTLKTSTCDSTGVPATALADDLSTTEQSNFGALNVSLLSQYPSMTDGSSGTKDQRSEAAGFNLVNFIRGQHGRENFVSGQDNQLYRTRANVLGDVVGGAPVYVQAPFNLYNDPGYAAFKTANASRTGMIYVAANDGMLHAFYAAVDSTQPGFASAGTEAWAIIPSAVLPSLYQLADNNYANVHRFFVDAAPVISDVKIGANWTTLLVGGFNAGAQGFYALDVTNPTTPKALWEFKPTPSACPVGLASPTAAAGQSGDCNVGYSFGQPVITKLVNGTWVVMVTSGYNNINGATNGGDGRGFLYVLNAATGKIIYKITTGVGSSTTPSGLAQLNNYVDSVTTDNTAVRVYGTDLFGNIWRFDVNDTIAPAGIEASLLATAKDPNGIPQPITTKPELGINGGSAMVFVGTGRLLGATDLSSTQVQSVYGIVDPLSGSTSPVYSDLRSSLAPLQFTVSATARTISCPSASTQCGSSSGWFVDLCDVANCTSSNGERVNVDMKLAAGNLVIASNVPSTNACVAGGTSWLTQLDYRNGLVVAGSASTAVSQRFSQGLIVGFAVIKLQDSSLHVSMRFSNATGGNVPAGAGTTGPQKRVSWREVVAP